MFFEASSPMMSQVQRTDDPPSTDVLNSVGMKRSMDGTSNASNSPKRRLSDDQEVHLEAPPFICSS
jgi:hypothetical protein